ncbi:sigma 54-interacting transcriptional regulator [uncultured Desulfovibrio sp.]|uniref:sigma 54-interacting transcriptional regulator n=1 Tax=uncultured Desulfovibrio sp. TaxID=167968 RepID=UPI0026037432|nr:sigma 54-interacting transcriptional regulator [uncultured Desulfovibrio sp.]
MPSTSEFQMTLIGPYKGVDAGIFRQVARELHCHLQFVDAVFDEAVEPAKRLSPETCDVVLSRGVTVDVVKAHTSIPVVPIDLSAWDVLQVLQPYAGRVRKAAFFRYGQPLPGLARVGQALGMEISEYLYTTRNQMRLKLMQLSPADVDLFVARGSLICQWADDRGFATLEIIDGEISARRTLFEAVNVAHARRTERQRVARLEAILNAVEEGIVAYDARGQVNLVNPAAESLLKCSGKKAVGRHVRSIMPGAFPPDRITAQEPEHGRIQTIRGTTLVINRIPILFQGRSMGTVCSFSDARRISRAEEKLRTSLKAKGFTTRYSFEDICTCSPSMQHLKEIGRLYASTNASLLICGESGTGKELFAQSIHAASERADKPFVAVNCASIPEGLLESELFGYEEGAFTGARRQGKAGMFELAHTGTLFLDEIGDLPLPLQGRLLRVLQERELVRVGGTQVVHLDVRVLCATHQDLRSLVEEGRFRADLFYRINVLSLYVPPLRERPEDIMELAVTYLEAHLDNPPPDEELRRQLRTPLLRHTWPGNIRELLSIMERLAIVANHMRQVDDWAGLLARIWEVSVQEAGQKEYGGEPVTLREHLAREEARFIDRTIDACGGDLGRAAARLGISRMTLWRKLHPKEGREDEAEM